MLKTLHDGLYTVKPYPIRNEATFHLLLIANTETEKVLCIATEKAENQGMSVTNCAETIASVVCQRFDVPTEALIFLDHYDHTSYEGGGIYRLQEYEHYDSATFSWRASQRLTAYGLTREAYKPTFSPCRGSALATLLKSFGLGKLDEALLITLACWHEYAGFYPATEQEAIRQHTTPDMWPFHHANLGKLLSYGFLESHDIRPHMLKLVTEQ